MGLLIVLIVLCSGFITININKKHFFKLHRYEGQFLYIKCATAGIKAFLISIIIFVFLNYLLRYDLLGYLHYQISFLGINRNQFSVSALNLFISALIALITLIINLIVAKKEKINTSGIAFLSTIIIIYIILYLISITFNSQGHIFIKRISQDFGIGDLMLLKLLIISVISLIYSFVSSHIINLINELRFISAENDTQSEEKKLNYSEAYKISILSQIFSDSPLDVLFLNSYLKEVPLMIHMNNSKVYVGIVFKFAEPNESQGLNQEIAIVPIWSGFRNKDNFKVIKNTFYFDDEDNFIILKQSDIVSATEYNHELFVKNESK
ncbi:MAG: hypothetical protein DWP95_07960 [Proteobacteria bacterium]|nr:MAG: hypothetical protein DWP95_07960 [Pseudomonadota bacterium]